MKCEQWNFIDGTPCAVKVACTVWSGGKDGDYFKVLPIAIVNITNPSTIKRCVWRFSRQDRSRERFKHCIPKINR